jgi:hypothetical protein
MENYERNAKLEFIIDSVVSGIKVSIIKELLIQVDKIHEMLIKWHSQISETVSKNDKAKRKLESLMNDTMFLINKSDLVCDLEYVSWPDIVEFIDKYRRIWKNFKFIKKLTSLPIE